MIHPILAAKQAVTIDHIPGGRFGLNLVMGWFKPEMEMFGAVQREHDERYQVGEEWLSIVKRLWTEEEPFSFDGEFFSVLDAEAWPKPVQRPHPVIMNAGASPAGSDFSARNADISFVGVDDPATAGPMVSSFKRMALEQYGRRPRLFSGAYVICLDTEAEAQDALREILAGGDRRSLDGVNGDNGYPTTTPGLLYKDGWYLLDDTPSALYDPATQKVAPRPGHGGAAYQDKGHRALASRADSATKAADVIAARLTGPEPGQFRDRYIHECISLARRHGLIQFLNADESPKRGVLTGRKAIAYKNATLNGAKLLFRHPGHGSRAADTLSTTREP